MRTANIDGRLALVQGSVALDVERASGGRFGADPQAVFDRWDEFREWAAGVDVTAGAEIGAACRGAVAPAPRQVFAIGLNYADHAAEGNVEPPKSPPTFTKFLSSLAGPYEEVVLPAETVDWEVELVAVIGKTAIQVAREDAWDYVAGLTVGQDLSERRLQTVGPAPQFSLGKSFPGFGPMGPELVSVDEFSDPDDLELGCSVNGVLMQKGRTSGMIFSVPELIARISAVCTLYPGDVIFTGTPGGVGAARDPRVFLKPGDELVSYVEGIGTIRQRMVAS
ncbi:fumarylacetoacetate hydrolase family protein [Planotetraspora sp. GP83]|uniref:fumarylacetoacetate hydrolase family protein n=1 Tax=Planotetraspora sp. GP83 TaxID=3156264 RepID=UPI00351871E3